MDNKVKEVKVINQINFSDIVIGIGLAFLILAGVFMPREADHNRCNSNCIRYGGQAGEALMSRTLKVCKCWTSNGKVFEFVDGRK